MRLWLLTRRITHLLEKGDRIRGEALHLAPQRYGFRLLRFTLQLQTPKNPHMHLHSFWLLPFPKLRLSHSRWAVHCCPRLRDDSSNSGSDSDVTLHFTIFESRASPASIATLFFWPFQLFLFCRFFSLLLHFCFWTFFVSDLWFFLICIFVLSPPSFWKFFFVRHEFLFVGSFLFHVFFLFSCCVSPCFPFLKSFLFFPKKSVSFMLVLFFAIFLLFRSLHKISRFFCSVFSSSLSSIQIIFLCLPLFAQKNPEQKKMGDGLLQRMSRGRDQWQLIVHRLHSLNNVTARGSDQELFQSRNAIFDAYEKSGSPWN